jgi:Mrp family chromosome partitioning ATPase
MSRILKRGSDFTTFFDEGGLVVGDEPTGFAHLVGPDVAASIRYLVARLQLHEATGFPTRLALTSALDGEGVTFTARSLGAVLASDLDRNVCVVDLNWWSPSDQSYAKAPGLGLVNIVDGLELDDILTVTSIPKLCLVPAGRAAPGRSAMMAKGTELALAIEHLAMRFDHLILDLPALAVTGDALSLARLADAVALVVQHGVTPEAQVRSALQELRGVNMVGVVLNRQKSSIPRWLGNLVGV